MTMGNVKRIYVEKKKDFAVKAMELKADLRNYLNLGGIEEVRMFIRYDVENLSDKVFEQACRTVFSEPPVDILYRETLDVPENGRIFSVEYLPGQFDQRADSAIQCVQFLKADEQPVIRTAVTYLITGKMTDEEFERIKAYCINPVDSRETGDIKPETLVTDFEEPADVKIFDGFIGLSGDGLRELYDSLGLAMTFQDFLHIQNYFAQEEKRNPSMTEIRVLDTYWSDHCRHTTFSTELKRVEFEDGFYREPMETTWKSYLDTREELFKDRPDKFVCLMDLALMAMRRLKKDGKLEDMEQSDEINACSVIVPVEMDYGDGPVTEEWLVFFKNETHNHPTEIEPFGGAATCLGGAIRDPLSGRGYVYQAMRVTGAADPTVPVADTLKGKLPQKKLVRGAASGYSSYGNQIGLATGYVKEIYHPDYVAKRMEIGAVMGAAPRRNVIRENSDPDDVIILLGGRTGRDGCGGATGSSKVHTEKSIETCGAEVQKGNAPTERKIQRLFRREEVSRLIKKCNDFGAGGVSVAIGELADGLIVDLDLVPKKYAGLDGTELAISESQERMAVVVSPDHVDAFLGYAAEENLEAVPVAVVTEEPRLVLKWRGKKIVDIARSFLDTNGAHQETDVLVDAPSEKEDYFKRWAVPKAGEALESGDVKGAWLTLLADLNVCSQKGLVEMFDSSIGAGSVLMPYGGRYQLTETQAMVAKLPVLKGKTDAVTMMAYGFDPYLSSWSPYHGAIYAVTESMARIVANGGDFRRIRFTFQEYFRRMSADPERWSQPFAALLGAYDAQLGFGLPSIGGKDSMSGTFNNIHVPPTVITFAVTTEQTQNILSPEFKKEGNYIYIIRHHAHDDHTPNYEELKSNFDKVRKLAREGVIVSAATTKFGGAAETICKMAFGNKIGAAIQSEASLYDLEIGSIIVESKETLLDESFELLGITTKEPMLILNEESATIDEAIEAWCERYDHIYPMAVDKDGQKIDTPLYQAKETLHARKTYEHPKVIIPVFPGQNCEYDTAQQFERAGAEVETYVFNNLNVESIERSLEELSEKIASAQILMVVGGFSSGDEPDGSGKFIANVLSNPKVNAAIQTLLANDGLILGICNGFQALIKSGLLPYGDITKLNEGSPTLFRNNINRHVSHIARTRIASNKSPWLAGFTPGECHSVAMSHGEGKFVVSEEMAKELFANGQIATQYVDLDGDPTMNGVYNINGSSFAIEGITSADGRIFGKMGHSERYEEGLFQNIDGNKEQNIFANGVNYFRQK